MSLCFIAFVLGARFIYPRPVFFLRRVESVGVVFCVYICRSVRILPTDMLSWAFCYTAPLTFFPPVTDLQALCGSSFSALDNCIVVLLVV